MKGNLSAVLKKKGDLVLMDMETPSSPVKNEVLLRTLKVGICGSDVHIWQHGEIAGFELNDPIILGHETCAEVVEVGPSVKNLAVGDVVAVEPGVPCQECIDCRSGNYNLCREVTFHACPSLGGQSTHGTLTRYFKHNASFCYKLPEGVSAEEGALLEPLSVGVYACQRAPVTLGQCILVCGAGPIGLVTLLAAKAYGATHVCVTDVSGSRLQIAQTMGADSVVLSKLGENPQDVAARVIEAVGKLVDVTIDCVGVESTVTVGIHATKQGGVFVNVGCGQLKINIPMLAAMSKEIDIKGVFRYKNTWPLCIQLLSEGRIDVKRLVTHKFPLEQALEAFETAKSGVGIKVMIDCD